MSISGVGVKVRPMSVDDIEEILPLEQTLFAGDPPWTVETFRSELDGVPETRWYVVAELAGATKSVQLVGYAGLRSPGLAGEPADVLTIAVAPAYQRRKIGTVLMDALIEEARSREAGSLMLDVRADNEPALEFYRVYGFQRIAVRRAYYASGRTGLVLRKRLKRR